MHILQKYFKSAGCNGKDQNTSRLSPHKIPLTWKLKLIFNYHIQSDFSVVLLAEENLGFQNVSRLRYTLLLFLRPFIHQAHRQKCLLFCRTPIKTLEIIPRPAEKQVQLPKAFETSQITGYCTIHVHRLL